MLPHLPSAGLYLTGRENVFTRCIHILNFVLFVSPSLVTQENSLVDYRSSKCSIGGSSCNLQAKSRDCLHFSDGGRLGSWSEAIYTVKVGEPGVEPGSLAQEPGHLTPLLRSLSR